MDPGRNGTIPRRTRTQISGREGALSSYGRILAGTWSPVVTVLSRRMTVSKKLPERESGPAEGAQPGR